MKNFVSKLASLCLFGVLLVGIVAPISTSAMLITDGEGTMEAFVYLPGEILEEDNGTIRVRSSIDEAVVVVNITDETFVIDAISGLNTNIAERTGNIVSIFHSPIMTRSYPPITNAFAVITGIPEDFTAPRYTIVEDVEAYNGDIRIISDNGGLIITISSDTNVTEPMITSRGAAFEKANISEGDRLLLYYVAVLMSHPAQATARKAVLLEHGEIIEQADNAAPGATEGVQNNQPGYSAGTPNGETNNGAAGVYPEAYPTPAGGFTLMAERAVEQNGATLVPLREVAEALGMEVSWNEAERSVSVSYGDTNANIRIGYDGEIRGNLTYVSLELFSEALRVSSHRLSDVIVFYYQ